MRDWWVCTLAMVFLGTHPVAGALLWIAGAAAFSNFRERLIFDLLRDLGGRAHALAELAGRYRAQLTTALPPALLAQPGVGPVSAAQLLACDARRFRNEAAFARCNGTAPEPASSGQTTRHRIDRGGDRQANYALHTIALSRALHDPETRAYIERRKRVRLRPPMTAFSVAVHPIALPKPADAGRSG